MMTIKLLYILYFILTLLNLMLYYTKWFRVCFLAINLYVSWCLYLYWILFNKMFFGAQYTWGINLYINILDLNWYLVFGFHGMSLFFCILTNFLITICILVNYYKDYSYKNLNLLLWILQLILFLFFTTEDLILFFICF